tara:strand:+ start:281 stop:712 length:432 start_codon:yes stop_codon:yes gene_type:complete
MKMVKNIAIVAFAASFMFAGVGFHMGNNYGNMDGGTTVATSWGATYDLNENTSIGYDSTLGMMFAFDVPAGISLRLGVDASSVADATKAGTSVGLGFTWWTGGTGLKTSISTNYDYVMAPGATVPAVQEQNGSNLSVVVGFGF